MLTLFILYPVITYAYIQYNKEKIEEKDNDFIARNEVVYGPYKLDRLDESKMGLSFFMVQFYKKVVFAFIIVFLSSKSSFQI
jgi:hypothetical protein